MVAVEGAFNMPFDLTTFICVLRNSAAASPGKVGGLGDDVTVDDVIERF